MLPVPDVNPIVPDVRVTLPVLVIVPEPSALRLMVPEAPVDVLALMLMLELLAVVERETVAVPEIAMAPPTVSVPPELTPIEPVVPEIAPKVVVPDTARIPSVLAPSVIV